MNDNDRRYAHVQRGEMSKKNHMNSDLTDLAVLTAATQPDIRYESDLGPYMQVAQI